MEEKYYCKFLSLPHHELEEDRKCCKMKYDNLPNFSFCSNVISQTLQELQLLKETYEDSALYFFDIKTDQIAPGFDKILEGLEKHSKLQDNLYNHYETVLEEYEINSPDKPTDLQTIFTTENSIEPIKEENVQVSNDKSVKIEENGDFDNTTGFDDIENDAASFNENFEYVKIEADFGEEEETGDDLEKPKEEDEDWVPNNRRERIGKILDDCHYEIGENGEKNLEV